MDKFDVFSLLGPLLDRFKSPDKKPDSDGVLSKSADGVFSSDRTPSPLNFLLSLLGGKNNSPDNGADKNALNSDETRPVDGLSRQKGAETGWNSGNSSHNLPTRGESPKNKQAENGKSFPQNAPIRKMINVYSSHDAFVKRVLENSNKK